MSDELRWGILGTANIASQMVRAIGESRNGRVAAVASRSRERAESWAAGHGVPAAFGAYEDLLAAKDAIDLVYIPLPNSLHADWTLQALDAGYPVLCEKPLAADAEQAKRVAEASHKAGLPVLEGFMYRHHPQYEQVFDLLDAGRIGELCCMDAEFSFFEDDRSALPASAALAGGALMDVGCYCVHLMRWVAGSEPVRVAAFERRVGGVDDSLMGLLDFPHGPLGRFMTSIASCERHGATLVGSEASLIIEQPWVPGLDSTRLLICRHGAPDEVIQIPGADAYRLQVEHFVDLCTGKTEARFPIDDGVANMVVIAALQSSAADPQKGPVSI